MILPKVRISSSPTILDVTALQSNGKVRPAYEVYKKMDIVFESNRVTRFFAAIVLGLGLAHLAGQISTFALGHSYLFGLVPLFDVGREANVPTLYSSLALLFCVDETAALHERLIEPVRTALNLSGYLYFAWVVPAGLALIAFLLAFAKFIIQLPGRTRFLFILAGAIYVTGAIGFELLGAQQFEIYGHAKTVPYAILVTIEELLEMMGVVVFIHALMTYIGSNLSNLRFRVAPEVVGQAVQPVATLSPGLQTIEQ
jgi:hypothetical protein